MTTGLGSCFQFIRVKKRKRKKTSDNKISFSPDVTSTSTGKISSSCNGAGRLALIRINAV